MEATLEAVQRSTRGKNEARRLRAAGQLPAVVYGAQKDGDAVAPLPVAVDPKPLFKILHSESGANTLITLKVDGVGDSRVLVKDFLLDPVTNRMLHADFLRVNMDRPITVTVPVVLKGEPKSIKLQGGILDFLHREIDIESLPGSIPDAIEIDVTELVIGQGVYVRDVAANATWTPVSDPDLMLVHVIAQRVVEAAPETAAAAAPEAAKKGGKDEGKK